MIPILECTQERPFWNFDPLLLTLTYISRSQIAIWPLTYFYKNRKCFWGVNIQNSQNHKKTHLINRQYFPFPDISFWRSFRSSGWWWSLGKCLHLQMSSLKLKFIHLSIYTLWYFMEITCCCNTSLWYNAWSCNNCWSMMSWLGANCPWFNSCGLTSLACTANCICCANWLCNTCCCWSDCGWPRAAWFYNNVKIYWVFKKTTCIQFFKLQD
jgi:hypothetical protein